MVLGIILSAAALTGLIYGNIKKHKGSIIISIISLILISAVWLFFYCNPY